MRPIRWCLAASLLALGLGWSATAVAQPFNPDDPFLPSPSDRPQLARQEPLPDWSWDRLPVTTTSDEYRGLTEKENARQIRMWQRRYEAMVQSQILAYYAWHGFSPSRPNVSANSMFYSPMVQQAAQRPEWPWPTPGWYR